MDALQYSFKNENFSPNFVIITIQEKYLLVKDLNVFCSLRMWEVDLNMHKDTSKFLFKVTF